MTIDTYARWLGCVTLLAVSAVATFHLAQDGATRNKRQAQLPAHPAAASQGIAMPAAAPPPVTPAQTLLGTVPAPQQSLYQVESSVRKARLAGASENEVYRIRASTLSTQTIALLSEREKAESQWKEQAAPLQLMPDEH